MSLLGKIFDFIKGLLTRPGLHTFLQKYQHAVTTKLEELAHVNSGKGLNEWWEGAFGEIKGMVTADGKDIADNWVAIAMNLGYEVIKAEQEKHQLKQNPSTVKVEE